MLNVQTKLSGDMAGALDRFEAKIKTQVLRSGAAAMALVIYEEARAKVPERTGLLKDSIYRVFSEDRSDANRQTYHVSWNKKTAPHGHLIEYGHFQYFKVVQTKDGDWITLKSHPLSPPRYVGPQPFMRPAFDHVGRAIQAGLDRMAERLKEES